MRTVSSEWEKYAAAVYPDGMTQLQEKQVRQAFYGGVVVGVLLSMETIATNPNSIPELADSVFGAMNGILNKPKE